MRTLYITGSNVPYARVSGGQAASLSVLESYARLGGPVTLVALAERSDSNIDLSHLRGVCERVELAPCSLHYARHRLHHSLLALRALISGQSFKLLKFRSTQLDAIMARLAAGEDWDLVHFDSLPMAQYGSHFPRSRRILLEQNVEWEIFERHARYQPFLPLRLFARLEAVRLRRHEIELTSGMDCVLTLSNRDGEILRSAGCLAPTVTLRLPLTPSDEPSVPFEAREASVISLGNLTSLGRQHGTIWFHQHVWPIIRSSVPGAEWHIVGANPPASIRRFDGEDGVRVHGFLKDLSELLAKVRACVVPLHVAGGIRIKILDMFALGIPCISTSVGAQGIDVVPGRDLLLSDDPGELATFVSQVIQDKALHDRLAASGRAYLLQNHSQSACDSVIGRLLDLHEAIPQFGC